MAAEPIPRLERALLHSFADQGPNPTALGACPGAAFVCNGRAHRSAPGWWAVFSCDMVIRCEETRTAGGTRAEQAELRFVPSGTGVMDGKVWTWQMKALRTGGQARLFVQDAAPYPSPLTNLLAYHALVVSRDALCSRVAHLLGTAQAEKCSQPWLRQHPHDRSAVPDDEGPRAPIPQLDTWGPALCLPEASASLRPNRQVQAATPLSTIAPSSASCST